MTTLKDRERDLENYFAHGLEVDARVKAKAYRYFGLWAANKLGLSDDADVANEYAMSLVVYEYDNTDKETAVAKVVRDFETHKVNLTKYDVKDAFEEFMAKARNEIMGA